jgi:hypothetical protein
MPTALRAEAKTWGVKALVFITVFLIPPKIKIPNHVSDPGFPFILERITGPSLQSPSGGSMKNRPVF